MTSVAEKRRRKKLKASIPSLKPVDRRKARGGNRTKEIEMENASVALEARARQMGVSLSKAGDMRDQLFGCPAGQAIAIVCGYKRKSGLEEAKRLYDHYQSMTAAEMRYHKSLGQSIFPKVAKIEMEPEKIEARAEDSVDLRTEEERDKAAANRWMHWRGNLGMLQPHMQTAIHDISKGRVSPLDGGDVTPAGFRFVDAMREMHRLMEGFRP